LDRASFYFWVGHFLKLTGAVALCSNTPNVWLPRLPVIRVDRSRLDQNQETSQGHGQFFRRVWSVLAKDLNSFNCCRDGCNVQGNCHVDLGLSGALQCGFFRILQVYGSTICVFLNILQILLTHCEIWLFQKSWSVCLFCILAL
jgi:hypothetical protein